MELIDSSIEAIRALSHKQVTPLKNIDLKALVQKLLEDFRLNTMSKFSFTYAVPVKLLSDDLKLNIYRIIQELLNNIQKHADAKNVTIAIESEDKDNTIVVTVTDDGKGFDTGSKRKGIGLSNIMHRVELYNGNLILKSNPGKGSKISVVMPYQL